FDSSGPWSDPEFHGDVQQGLPALREKWIRARRDVEEIEGRVVRPIDDGYLSEKHAALESRKRRTPNAQRSTPKGFASKALNGSKDDSSFVIRHSSLPMRRPLRAKPGKVVTQLAYARQGIITPEMEFIAIRENGRQASSRIENRESRIDQNDSRFTDHDSRDSLLHRHAGS